MDNYHPIVNTLPVAYLSTIPRGDQAVSSTPRLPAKEVFKVLIDTAGWECAWDWVTHNRLLTYRGIFPLDPVNGITVEQAKEEMRMFGFGFG